MRSTEFDGFICDNCGEPVKADKAEGKMISASVQINNTDLGFEDEDFCTKTCFNKRVKETTREDAEADKPDAVQPEDEPTADSDNEPGRVQIS